MKTYKTSASLPVSAHRPVVGRRWQWWLGLPILIAGAAWVIAQTPPVAPATPGESPPKVPAWTAVLAPSDGRLKSQPQPLDHAAGLISRLRPKRFLLHTGHLDARGRAILDPDPVPSLGFIAQEVGSVVPEAVYRPEDEAKEFWMMDYTKLVPVLVRAVQEQQSDLQSQSSRIQSLESQISGLEAEIAKLKEITGLIDDATRRAFAQLRNQVQGLESRIASAEGKTSCTCSK